MSFRPILPALALAAAVAVASACGDDGGTQPGTLRFGQIGEIRLHLASPLLLGQGELQQSLTWNSSGPWQLTELMSYRGVIGDQNTFRAASELLASDYAIWITQVNDRPELTLFDPQLLDASVIPECGPTRTRITLQIRDAVLDEDRQWVRCVDGTMGSLVTAGAGPDIGAARVANAAVLLREYIFPPPLGFTSSYHGSFPFATLARGEDTPVQLTTPTVLPNADAWSQFWIAHNGSIAGLPVVDFSKDIVLIAAIGQRPEAGETVEVRRVLAVDGGGSVIEVVHSVPGNFCSPVARAHRPFHAVVVPQLPPPITFTPVRREAVPCGA